MVSRAANVIIRAIRLAPVAAYLLLVCASSSHPGWAQTPVDSTPAAVTPIRVTSPSQPSKDQAVTPSPAGSPMPDAKGAAEDPCEKAVTALGSGDLSAFKSLPPETRAAFERAYREHYGLAEVFSCLAVADDNSRYCDLLPNPEKDGCFSQRQFIHGLKALPKGASALPLVAARVYQQCTSVLSKADCGKMQEAMTTRDAAKCKGLPDDLSILCDAVVTGNASRCPKEGDDCSRTVALVAKLNKDGLEGLRVDSDLEVFVAAARDGKPACAPLLALLKSSCSQGTK